jgi:hypothetical protein
MLGHMNVKVDENDIKQFMNVLFLVNEVATERIESG